MEKHELEYNIPKGKRDTGNGNTKPGKTQETKLKTDKGYKNVNMKQKTKKIERQQKHTLRKRKWKRKWEWECKRKQKEYKDYRKWKRE